MRRILGTGIAVGIFALGAAAQDNLTQAKIQLDKVVAEAKMISVEGGVMGPAVKGAPYSADEIRENTQVLGDGTRIHNETKTTVYRDSEGRVRRETPNEISIWDPAAGTNYVLNPKNMTARKMTMNFVFKTAAGSTNSEAGQTVRFRYSTGSNNGDLAVVTPDEARAADEAKAMAAAGAKLEAQSRIAGTTLSPQQFASIRRPTPGQKESLGTQMMEGVNAEGVRVTSTIEQGAIGNDRAIQSTTERWYSQELQTNIMTKRSDPRSGEEVLKLTNIHRGEPSPVLFELPPGYTVVNGK